MGNEADRLKWASEGFTSLTRVLDAANKVTAYNFRPANRSAFLDESQVCDGIFFIPREEQSIKNSIRREQNLSQPRMRLKIDGE